MLLAAWTIGHVVTDRWYLTQFLWWLPTPLVLLSCIGAGVTWRVLAPGRVRQVKPDFTNAEGAAAKFAASRVQWLYVAAVVLTGVYVGATEWRLDNVFRAPAAPSADGVRVVAWNESWEPMKPMFDRLVGLKADIMMMANPHWTFDVVKYRASMGEPNFSVRGGNLALFSRYPIRRSGYCDLRITPEPNRPDFPAQAKGPPDTGNAMWVELEVPEFGRPIVVWCIDMPSDPWLDRARAFREARAAIDAFRGPVMERLENGLDKPRPLDDRAIGFPDPDMILGDCNTPRGSWSLTLLHPGMHNAFDDAGYGPAYTYPRSYPIIAIDQMMLSEHLRADEYRIIDMHGSRHRAQFGLIHAAK